MSDEKIAIRANLRYLRKKELSARTVKKEIHNVKDPGTFNKCVVQNWFKHFKEGDTSFEDKINVRETFCCKR